MVVQRRSGIAFGLVLILIGAWFLALQWVPGLQAWFNGRETWPFIVIGLGLVLLLFGIFVGAPGMAIPASILAGLGLLFYWQTATNDWASWAYAWTLIPGFVGVGIILMALLGQDTRNGLKGGAWLIFISLVLFIIFGSFLGGPFILGMYWPVLLIALGFIGLVRSFIRAR